jgi:hypothetical protein
MRTSSDCILCPTIQPDGGFAVPDLVVVVPTKGRPESVGLVVEAWRATGAFDEGAALTFAVDDDDPTLPRYIQAFNAARASEPYPPPDIRLCHSGPWQPMVLKLNAVALHELALAQGAPAMLGFMGDDHRPRSNGWAARYIGALRELGTGIVYGDDLIQHERLPTQWAMTSDIVLALGRMVPADVEHLYCDNAIMDLGLAADCIRYLPDVKIEHCHPVARRGAWDAGYERVNARAQYAKDHAAHERWKSEQLVVDAATVRGLKCIPTTIN